MKKTLTRLALTGLVFGMHASPAHAQDGGTMMAIMGLMMRCPAISSDGTQVAVYSSNPGDEKGAKTSLAIFAASGALKQRIAIVPPAVDPALAKKGSASAMTALESGAFKRMGRVARQSQSATRHDKASDPPPSYDTVLTSGDASFTMHLAQRQLTIEPTRAGQKLKPIKIDLGRTDGTCQPALAYTVNNTMAGFDADRGLFAFSVDIEDSTGPACFSHNFVVRLPPGAGGASRQ